MRIFSYSDFSNEAKKEENPVSLFNKDIKGLLDDMFAKVKKPKYEYDSDGYVKKIEFEIEKSDFDIDYKGEMENEYSEGVLKKREFVPVLVFSNKEESEKGGSYEIEFKIKKKKVEIKDKKEGERALQFGKDSDEQLLRKLKSRKMSDYNKEKVMDELKDRGVDFKNPFDEEEDYDIEKEAEKKFSKKDKKNESATKEFYHDEIEQGMRFDKFNNLPKKLQDRINAAYDKYGSDFLEELYELTENDGDNDDIESLLNDWGIEEEIMESATKEFYRDEIEQGMRFDEQPYTNGYIIDFDEVRNILEDEHGFADVDDMQIEMYYNYLVDQGENIATLTDQVFADMMYNDYLYPISTGQADEDDFDVETDYDLGVKNDQTEPITGIEPVDVQPVAQPIEQIQPMNVQMTQPVQPIEQPIQPIAPVQTPEEQEIKKWERFGIKLEIEKEEKTLNQLVNESLTIKKFSDDESLNESVNKVYENNKPSRTIETIYKNKQ